VTPAFLTPNFFVLLLLFLFFSFLKGTQAEESEGRRRREKQLTLYLSDKDRLNTRTLENCDTFGMDPFEVEEIDNDGDEASTLMATHHPTALSVMALSRKVVLFLRNHYLAVVVFLLGVLSVIFTVMESTRRVGYMFSIAAIFTTLVLSLVDAKRLAGVDRKVDEVDRKVDGVDRKVDAMDRKFDAMDRKFDVVDQRLLTILDRLPAADPPHNLESAVVGTINGVYENGERGM
jgi:hypothetical protein